MEKAAKPDNPFVRLSAIDVRPMLAKKGSFEYLSWPYAVAELRKADPTATWQVKRFDGGLPYLATELGYFVEVEVTVGGVSLSQIHPVLDGKNRPIIAPTAFDINTSIQRCLVKGAALHGLGLSVYAGEDITGVEHVEPAAQAPQAVTSPAANSRTKRPTQLKQVGTGLSQEQQAEVRRLVEETGADLQRLLDYFQVNSLGEIRASNFERVIRSLQHRRAA